MVVAWLVDQDIERDHLEQVCLLAEILLELEHEPIETGLDAVRRQLGNSAIRAGSPFANFGVPVGQQCDPNVGDRLARGNVQHVGRDGRAAHGGGPVSGRGSQSDQIVRLDRHATEIASGRLPERRQHRGRDDDRRQLPDALGAEGHARLGLSISSETTGGMSRMVGIR